MSEAIPSAAGLIGPNAVLQLLPVLDRFGGPAWRAEFLAKAGLQDMPDGTRMIPETEAANLHHYLRRTLPDMAPRLAAEAGRETANYILAHRIPLPAQWLLKALPERPAAHLLSRAISRHAWTFVGTGQFRVLTPWTFEIERNPLIAGETSDRCLCDWHRGVFSRLYQSLVAPGCNCLEVSCGAQSNSACCRFEIGRARRSG